MSEKSDASATMQTEVGAALAKFVEEASDDFRLMELLAKPGMEYIRARIAQMGPRAIDYRFPLDDDRIGEDPIGIYVDDENNDDIFYQKVGTLSQIILQDEAGENAYVLKHVISSLEATLSILNDRLAELTSFQSTESK